jgi:pimeloyl-ACP methyl ester carboxylesterase
MLTPVITLRLGMSAKRKRTDGRFPQTNAPVRRGSRATSIMGQRRHERPLDLAAWTVDDKRAAYLDHHQCHCSASALKFFELVPFIHNLRARVTRPRRIYDAETVVIWSHTALGWIIELGFGIMFAVAVFFCASFLYFVLRHHVGSLDYAVRTIAIGLLTAPVAALVTVFLIIFVVFWIARGVQFAWRSNMKSQQADKSEGGGPGDNSEVTVHLVHGTFEPNAPWTLPGSSMRKAIEEIGHKVKIARFSWSGANTSKARSKAARALAETLRASPTRMHYIVAHSHGGNIVREMSHLYPDTALKIRGVCLLSPPFIYRRKIMRTAGSLILLNSIGFVFAVQIPVAAVLVPLGLYWPYGVFAAAIPTLLVDLGLSAYCRRSYAKEMDSIHESVNFRDVQIYHAIGDEADSGLRFASFLHELCFGVLSQLKATAHAAKGKFHWPYVMSYMFFVCSLAYAIVAPAKQWVAVDLVGLGSIALAHLLQTARPSNDEPMVLVAAAMPIATFSFWLAVAKAMAYGDWRLIFCPDIFVSSSETPEGDYSVLKFAPQSDGTMIHSTHSHPQAVLSVAQWLASLLNH